MGGGGSKGGRCVVWQLKGGKSSWVNKRSLHHVSDTARVFVSRTVREITQWCILHACVMLGWCGWVVTRLAGWVEPVHAVSDTAWDNT